MRNIDTAELSVLTVSQLAAFAAGVVERGFDLYIDTAEPYRPHVWDAIELVWQWALGAIVDPGDAARLQAALAAESEAYSRIGDQTLELPFGVITAVAAALHSATFADRAAAAAASDWLLGEVDRADRRASIRHALDGRAVLSAVDEEALWQRGWLRTIVENDVSTAQSFYRASVATKPDWYVNWSS